VKRFDAAFIFVIVASACLPAPCTLAQKATPISSSARLTLRGLDGRDHRVTDAELAALTRVDTTVSAHHVAGRYGGVLLGELLSLVHAPRGDSLRGKGLAIYVLVQGADGYRVVFALADFDPGFADRIALVADRKDGAPLPAAEGPYHLIVPGEKRPARWVRQVTRIELRRAP
jgi:hypothetical protein